MLIANTWPEMSSPWCGRCSRGQGKFFLGLYELEDAELEDILIANKDRIHVILSNTSATDGSGTRATRRRASV